MKNEKLQKAAHRFADLTREIKGAERRVSEAQNSLSNLRNELSKLEEEMAQYVGPNVPSRLAATPGGTVTITHDPAHLRPTVRVFDSEGEEVRG